MQDLQVSYGIRRGRTCMAYKGLKTRDSDELIAPANQIEWRRLLIAEAGSISKVARRRNLNGPIGSGRLRLQLWEVQMLLRLKGTFEVDDLIRSGFELQTCS
jgi:hypothetical protein